MSAYVAFTVPPEVRPGMSFRASWSKDGSLAKAEQGTPGTLVAAQDEARQHRSCRSVTILSMDVNAPHAANRDKWYLFRIVR